MLGRDGRLVAAFQKRVSDFCLDIDSIVQRHWNSDSDEVLEILEELEAVLPRKEFGYITRIEDTFPHHRGCPSVRDLASTLRERFGGAMRHIADEALISWLLGGVENGSIELPHGIQEKRVHFCGHVLMETSDICPCMAISCNTSPSSVMTRIILRLGVSCVMCGSVLIPRWSREVVVDGIPDDFVHDDLPWRVFVGSVPAPIQFDGEFLSRYTAWPPALCEECYRSFCAMVRGIESRHPSLSREPNYVLANYLESQIKKAGIEYIDAVRSRIVNKPAPNMAQMAS